MKSIEKTFVTKFFVADVSEDVDDVQIVKLCTALDTYVEAQELLALFLKTGTFSEEYKNMQVVKEWITTEFFVDAPLQGSTWKTLWTKDYE